MRLPQKSKLLQYVEQLESETAWSDEQFPCFKCYKKGKTSCRTIVGRICISCIEEELREFAKGEKLRKWSLKEIIRALSLDGMLHKRLTAIWRFQDIWDRFSSSQPESGRLLIMLIQNLGYMKNSPPAYIVREGAVEACKNMGHAVLPFLLEMCSKNPWQFYANVILSAASIDPDDLRVRKLVEKASDDSNPEVRKRAYISISDNNSQWAAGLMEKLKNDPDPSVKEFVKLRNNEPSYTTTPETQNKKIDIMTHLEELINKNYSLDILRTIYPIYLSNLDDDGKIIRKTVLSPKSLSKIELVLLFAKIFKDKKYFQIFMDSLQDDVKEILKILVWEGGLHNVDTFKKRFGSEIIVYDKTKSYYLYAGKPNPLYFIFRILTKNHYSTSPSLTPYYLSLDDELRDQFKNYLEQPSDYNLTPVKEIDKTEFLFQDQGQIISKIILFYTYIQQDNLKFSKSGDKILATSIKHMSDYCGIKEFYDEKDKNLKCIRTQMIADLLLDIKKEEFAEPVDLLKTVVDELLSEKSQCKFVLRELLYHIKGLHYLSGGYNGQSLAKNEKRVRLSMLNLIKEMPVSQWISAENIIKYCTYRSNDFEIIDKSFAADYLYFQRFYQKGYRWTKESVYYDKYTEVLFIPFIKSFMFLCAGFGILDIAYDSPKNEVFQEKMNSYLSIFDSLKYVRLTSLGAYLLGLSKDYEVKFELKEAKVTLDDQRLIINLDEKDTLKSLVLDKIADKITDTCFAVSYNSFLKSCASKEDIRQKIRLFRENISSSPPPIWKEFINEIMNKINPMTEEKNMKVYKLKPNDELISLIAKDDVLKKYILKAENFHIIINSKHLRPVKARLEEFGYLLDKI